MTQRAKPRGPRDDRTNAEHAPFALDEGGFRSIVEAFEGGIWATDAAGRATYINERMASMLGYRVEELLGRSLADVLHEDSHAPPDTIIQRDPTGRSVRQDLSFRHRNGERRWCDVTSSPMTDPEGRFVGLLNTISDISERRSREERFEATSALFREFGNAVEDVAWISDWPQRTVAYVSPAYRTVWGRFPASLYNKPGDWLEGIHPDDRARVTQAFESDIVRGCYDETYRVVRPDGAVRWVRDRGFPVRNARGQVHRIAGIAEDVTEGHRVAVFRQRQTAVLERLATDQPLSEVLDALVLMVEEQADDMLCSVLLYDEAARRLRHGAAPSLPQTYNEAIDGVEIGPAVGSCGTAVHRGERVVVEDILVDPLWTDYRHLARAHALRASWSQPIFSLRGKILGTFAMYYREPRRPGPRDIELIEAAAHLAGVAIELRGCEGRLIEEELRLRQIIDLVPHMIFAKDRDGNFLLANRAVAESYGKSVEQLLGTEHRAVHADSSEVARMLADDAEVIDSGSPKFIPEETYTDHRGRRRVLETTKIPFRESGSGRPAILGVAVDITERKALAEKLSDHLGLMEELFFDRGALPLDTLGRILDAHTDLLLVVGPDQRVAEANRALRDALGLSREALIGASLEQIFPRGDHAAFYALIERLQAAGRIQDALCELTLRDGSRIAAECQGVRRDGEGGEPAQLRLLLRDRARHNRLSTALLRTEQLVTTGRLAAGVAHEINNPLQALLLHLDSVEAELPADFTESESLLAIKQGIARIQQVVNDLLDLHRIGSHRRERVDLNAIVREATRLATSQFQERGIAQYVHLADDLPAVSGVSQHLYQIVLNLLLNGAEAIGRRGRLDVTTRAEGGSVIVQIRDSGKGMAPEEMAEIFAPSYTRRQGGGTGLGLFVTYNLIKENDGSIEVESRPGEGSLFRVRFPRLDAEKG